MKNLMKADFRYAVISGLLLGLMLLSGAIAAGSALMMKQYAANAVKMYEWQYEYALQHEQEDPTYSIEAEMEAGYIMHDGNTVENPVPYFLEQGNIVVSYFNPRNMTACFGELCTVILPVIAVLLSAGMVGCDARAKTERLKISRYGRKAFRHAKQVSGILMLFFLILFAGIVFYLAERILYANLSAQYDLSVFTIETLSGKTILLQILQILLSGIFYYEFSYVLCNLLHAYIPITLGCAVAAFLLTPKFKYGMMNVKYFLEQQVFRFHGIVAHSPAQEIPLAAAIAEAVLFILCIIAVNAVITENRSEYIGS